ncbi:MAG: hypothetical protein ACXWNU_08000, partial [Candidatus Binataceae bacterium]
MAFRADTDWRRDVSEFYSRGIVRAASRRSSTRFKSTRFDRPAGRNNYITPAQEQDNVARRE